MTTRRFSCDVLTFLVILGGYGSVPKNDGIGVGNGQLAPRLGFAYRLTPTTVIRAGYGISSDPYSWHVLRNAYPAVILDTNSAPNTGDYIPAASLTGLNGAGLGAGTYNVPTGIVLSALPDLSNGSAKLPTNAGTTTIPTQFNRGFINSYNVAVQQQFKNALTVNLGYVGTYQVRPVINMNANPSLPGTGSAGGLLSQKWGANYTGGINVLNPYLHSRYDSMQSQVSYDFVGGSNVKVAYTWSKIMDYADNEDLGGLSYPYPDAAVLAKNYGPVGYDRKSNLEASGVIALPFGKNEPWLHEGPGSWILGGWLVNPVFSVMSGLPFTVTAAGI